MGIRFGKEVRNARIKKRYALRHVSDELGFTPAYISDIERGNRNPPAAHLVARWAEFLGLDRDDLVHLAAIDRPSVELVTHGNYGKSELANMLARAWEEMTPDQVEALRDQTAKILGGDN